MRNGHHLNKGKPSMGHRKQPGGLSYSTLVAYWSGAAKGFNFVFPITTEGYFEKDASFHRTREWRERIRRLGRSRASTGELQRCLAAWKTRPEATAMLSEFGKKGGAAGGRKALESGRIFNLSRYVLIRHGLHYHRSSLELRACVELHGIYDSRMLHENVRYKGIEIDFVVGSDSKRPDTWIKVIEQHIPRTWEGETLQSYADNRTAQLRSLGVSCPVEVRAR